MSKKRLTMKNKRFFLGLLSLFLFVATYCFAQQIVWEKIPSQPPGVTNNIFFSKDSIVFAVTTNGLFRSRDNGKSWETTGATSLTFIQFGITTKGTLLHTNYPYTFERSTDDGDSWSTVNVPPFQNEYTAYTADSLKVFAGQYRGQSGCIVSYDDGINWTNVGNGLPWYISNHEKYYQVFTFLLKENLIFAGTWDGIYKADTTNYLWQATPCGEYITNLLLHPNGELIGFSPVTNKLYRSNDNGITWNDVPIPMGVGYRGTTITEQGYLLCGIRYNDNNAQRGMYISYNKGTNWLKINQGLPVQRPRISTVKCDSQNFIWIGSDSGIYRSTEPILTNIILEFEDSPLNFKLHQNYPNPFNPVTTIKYQIPKLSFITIKIYDVLGNEIATIVNEEKPAGSYEVEFDGDGLTSGIYFFRLQAGSPSAGSGQSFVETKKMVLLK